MKHKKSRITLLTEFDSASPQTIFDQATVAAVRACSEATLERERWLKTGIPFLKLSARCVRYKKSEVLRFLSNCGDRE